MKKVIIISLGTLLMLSLSGCAANELADKVTTTVEQSDKAENANLENDVRNTVTNVASYIATNPNVKDLSQVKIVQTGDNKVKVSIPNGKTIFEYQVVGTNANGETFTFDAATGKYK
jgi:outer membrane murein-binding lipoprotein Lpp